MDDGLILCDFATPEAARAPVTTDILNALVAALQQPSRAADVSSPTTPTWYAIARRFLGVFDETLFVSNAKFAYASFIRTMAKNGYTLRLLLLDLVNDQPSFFATPKFPIALLDLVLPAVRADAKSLKRLLPETTDFPAILSSKDHSYLVATLQRHSMSNAWGARPIWYVIANMHLKSCFLEDNFVKGRDYGFNFEAFVMILSKNDYDLSMLARDVKEHGRRDECVPLRNALAREHIFIAPPTFKETPAARSARYTNAVSVTQVFQPSPIPSDDAMDVVLPERAPAPAVPAAAAAAEIDFKHFCFTGNGNDNLANQIAVLLSRKSEVPTSSTEFAWHAIASTFLKSMFLADNCTTNGRFKYHNWVTQMDFYKYTTLAFLKDIAKHRPSDFRTFPERYRAMVPEVAPVRPAVAGGPGAVGRVEPIILPRNVTLSQLLVPSGDHADEVLQHAILPLLKAPSCDPSQHAKPTWEAIAREVFPDFFLASEFLSGEEFAYGRWVVKMGFYNCDLHRLLAALARHQPVRWFEIPANYRSLIPDAAWPPRNGNGSPAGAAVVPNQPPPEGAVPIGEIARIGAWATSTEPSDSHACTVCLDKQRNALLIPCAHLICSSCVVLLAVPRKCPTCRTLIVSVVHVYG